MDRVKKETFSEANDNGPVTRISCSCDAFRVLPG